MYVCMHTTCMYTFTSMYIKYVRIIACNVQNSTLNVCMYVCICVFEKLPV